MKQSRAFVGLALAVLLSGCASAHYYPVPHAETIGGCATPIPERDVLVGVALSGGGSRAALFGSAGLEALAGVRMPDGGSVPFECAFKASIVQPDGPGTQAYIVYDNYRVIMKWNKSTYFATAVGMLADRSLGDDATHEVEFLGSPAAFPLGPWRMAAMLRRPVFLMAGLYLGANRYELHFVELADFSKVERSGRDAAIREAVQRYADSLADLCHKAPYNWFNFFDFWQKK